MTNHKDFESAIPLMFEPEEIRYDFEFDRWHYYIVNWSTDTVAGAEVELMVTFVEQTETASRVSLAVAAMVSALVTFLL